MAHHGEHEVVWLRAVHPQHHAVRLARDEGQAQLVRLHENVDYKKYFFICYFHIILLNFLFIYFKLILLRDPSAGNTEDQRSFLQRNSRKFYPED